MFSCNILKGNPWVAGLASALQELVLMLPEVLSFLFARLNSVAWLIASIGLVVNATIGDDKIRQHQMDIVAQAPGMARWRPALMVMGGSCGSFSGDIRRSLSNQRRRLALVASDRVLGLRYAACSTPVIWFVAYSLSTTNEQSALL